jgi:hypothetical protein
VLKFEGWFMKYEAKGNPWCKFVFFLLNCLSRVMLQLQQLSNDYLWELLLGSKREGRKLTGPTPDDDIHI